MMQRKKSLEEHREHSRANKADAGQVVSQTGRGGAQTDNNTEAKQNKRQNKAQRTHQTQIKGEQKWQDHDITKFLNSSQSKKRLGNTSSQTNKTFQKINWKHTMTKEK